jgi:hypothetical protein
LYPVFNSKPHPPTRGNQTLIFGLRGLIYAVPENDQQRPPEASSNRPHPSSPSKWQTTAAGGFSSNRLNPSSPQIWQKRKSIYILVFHVIDQKDGLT